MFQVFGDEVYDSNEICNILKNSYNINVITDLTKSLDKEDTIAIKCSVNIDLLEISEKDVLDENKFLSNMNKCDKYIKNITDNLKIKYSLSDCRSYKYDQYAKEIKVIICIMYIETARKKLNSTMKRLLKNND